MFIPYYYVLVFTNMAFLGLRYNHRAGCEGFLPRLSAKSNGNAGKKMRSKALLPALLADGPANFTQHHREEDVMRQKGRGYHVALVKARAIRKDRSSNSSLGLAFLVRWVQAWLSQVA